ncbi:myoD family inhibitor isoform X4 [Delphinapterus leucas]|nr:myoD family inhibitor isoform X4 [Delphinapterus leucas]
MSQVSGQRPPHCDAPHGAPSAAPGPAQTLSLLPGLEVVTGSAQPAESALEEGSLEEVAPFMPQSNGPGASQALDSTDLDIPTEAVTRQPQGNPLGCTPLVANGSGHPSELGGTRRTGNGALGGPKAHRKLQTHPSLASQGSKKSKGSTKSAASQIPLQAQEAPGRLACRLLRPLHPVLPVLRVPDAVQHRPGLRHVRLLQLRGLVPLLLLLRLRRVCRLRPALRPGLRHPGRLLRVGRLPGDLHGVLWALLLLLTRGVPGCHTRLDRPLPRASPTLPEPSRNPSPVRVRCRSSLLVSLDNST